KPEPRPQDLPPSPPSPTTEERVATLNPAQRARFNKLSEHLPDDDAVILAEDVDLASYYEAVVAVYDAPRSVANWIINEVQRERKNIDDRRFPVEPSRLATLVQL